MTLHTLLFLLQMLEMVSEGKNGDSPFVYNLNLKVKKEKKQSNYTNPDPWARIVGSRNTQQLSIWMV